METKKIYLPLVAITLLSLSSCVQNSSLGYKNEVVKVPTLRIVDESWTKDTIADGYVHYTFSGYDEISRDMQNVNVIEIDLTNPAYQLRFVYTDEPDTLSAVAQSMGAICGINGGYEPDAIYIRTDSVNHSEVTIGPEHSRFWKHEAAVCSDGGAGVEIIYPGTEKAIETYKQNKARNIIASTPMLVDDYDPVGAWYVNPPLSPEEHAEGIKGTIETPRLHQGVRHPRTAVALTEDKDLLLITIDGRWPGRAEGMTAAETTEFIVRHFRPQYALNLDGGGSTTMYIKGHGADKTDIVNYPTDRVRDYGRTHYGQRRVQTFLVITPVE